MKTTVGFCICFVTIFFIIGLSVKESEAGKKNKALIADRCEKDDDCETNKCCKFRAKKYCQHSCSEIKQERQASSPDLLCSPAKKRYRVFKEGANWWQAMSRCCGQGNDARLADSETDADTQFFRTIPHTYDKGVWIGGTALLSEQFTNLKYIWVGTDKRAVDIPNADFDNWNSCAENNNTCTKSEHCIHLRDKQNSEFNDLDCNFSPYFYMCYYPNEVC